METMNRGSEAQVCESDEEICNNASVEDTKVETRELTAEEIEILKTISKHTDSTSCSLFWHTESGSDSPTSILVWPDNMKIMRKAVNRLKKLSVEQLNKKHVLLIEREKKLQLQILRARLELIHVYKTCDEHLGISSQTNRDSKKRKRKTSNSEKRDGEEKEKKKKVRVSTSKNSKSDEDGKDCSDSDLKKKEPQIGKKRQRVEEAGNEAKEEESGEVTNASDTKVEKKVKASKSFAIKGPSSSSGKNTLKKNGKAVPLSNNSSAKKGKSSTCVEKKAVHTRFDDDSDDSSDDGMKTYNGNQGKDAVDFDNLDDSLDSEEDD
jgi:hypothetical protein